MTARYAIALGLVALLSLGAFVALQTAIRTQNGAAAQINLAGRQRMLSQRLALDCLRLMGAEPAAARSLRTTIIEHLDLLEETHAALVAGDPARDLPGDPSPRVQELYFHPDDGLDPLLRDYAAAIHQLLASDDSELRQQSLQRILHLGPGELLDGLDAIVWQYQAENEADVYFLVRTEQFVLLSTLLVLALEAAFIFAPMVRRVQVERAGLLRAEHNQRQIIDASRDGIVVLDRDGRIVRSNPAAQTLLADEGEPEVDIQGRFLAQCLGAAVDGGGWGERPPSGVATFAPPVRPELRLECSFGLLRGAAGERVMVVLRESTERLRASMQQLERKNRQLDQFAYAASHDLRAPLRAIANLSAWIAKDLGDDLPPSTAEHVRLLGERVTRLDGLIAGLHAYATAGRDDRSLAEIDCRSFIAEILREADPDGRFQQEIDCRIDHVRVERALLWQVVGNLVNNAVKHHHREHGCIRVVVDGDDEALEITVEDDGPGIPPEQQERIYDIFQTLRPKDSGTGLGLGLALVRRLIDDRGGELWLECPRTGGSRFTVRWPLRPPVLVEELSA